MTSPNPQEVRTGLEAILDRAARESAARGIAVARVDGLVIVHRLRPGLDARIAAATAASIFGAAEMASAQLDQGEIEQVMIQCGKGQIVAVHAGREAIIMALFDRTAALGLALMQLARAANDVSKVLDGV